MFGPEQVYPIFLYKCDLNVPMSSVCPSAGFTQSCSLVSVHVDRKSCYYTLQRDGDNRVDESRHANALSSTLQGRSSASSSKVAEQNLGHQLL